jgi:hypothetical protein
MINELPITVAAYRQGLKTRNRSHVHTPHQALAYCVILRVIEDLLKDPPNQTASLVNLYIRKHWVDDYKSAYNFIYSEHYEEARVRWCQTAGLNIDYLRGKVTAALKLRDTQHRRERRDILAEYDVLINKRELNKSTRRKERDNEHRTESRTNCSILRKAN